LVKGLTPKNFKGSLGFAVLLFIHELAKENKTNGPGDWEKNDATQRRSVKNGCAGGSAIVEKKKSGKKTFGEGRSKKGRKCRDLAQLHDLDPWKLRGGPKRWPSGNRGGQREGADGIQEEE